jgi:hypothetical protein
MTTTLRAPPAPAPSRAAQRKQRLLELENEQRLEDAEALKFTEVRCGLPSCGKDGRRLGLTRGAL